MRLGIDILLQKYRHLIKGKRLGILAHAASVNGAGRHTIAMLSEGGDWEVTVLFGPEHGLTTTAQDMEPVETRPGGAGNVPIYSLYGSSLDSLSPTGEMLKLIDVLVIDLQDIGARYYTYAWTAVLCAKACSRYEKKVVICDRPNPIGGVLVEGGGIEKGFESFVGLYSIPVRHGLTIGELVGWINKREKIGADVTVIPLEGWKREMNWPDTGLKWINPSPNIRSYNAALLYPGMCLLEGTNISEGRGTDAPFEIAGAPYFDTDEVIAAFEGLGLPGVHTAPTSFIPTSRKWAGKPCHGVRWVIIDREAFRPYLTGLAFIWLVNRLYRGKGFEWLMSPYEFVTDRPPIDLLTGSAQFREKISSLSVPDLHKLASTPEDLLTRAYVISQKWL